MVGLEGREAEIGLYDQDPAAQQNPLQVSSRVNGFCMAMRQGLAVHYSLLAWLTLPCIWKARPRLA